ncbi:hypothetical protein P3T35_007859 [Kitasatospora sp. GP30]|nr:hypothetical protein [Kitasatospora sp. GP30]
MGEHRRGGRPWEPLYAQTPEGEALALFLRARVDECPLTMRAAAARMRYSPARVGDFLSGRRSPEPDFVAVLLRVTVPDPQRRRLLQADADRLLRAARNPKERSGGDEGGHALAGQLERVRAQQGRHL